MVQALKQTVRIQRGGRVEVISPDLPDGEVAEVIVLVPRPPSATRDILGLFADEPELMDQIVTEAMAVREQPLRHTDGPSPAGH